jgi:Glutamate-cysteine ligase family 2(GCS2)
MATTAETPYTAYSYLEGGLMAVINAFAEDAVDRAEPLTVAAAYAQCRDAALAESAIGAVGPEIESHLVDLDHVADPVPWKRVEAIAAVVGKVAPGTAVTVEPGGQIELSGPPAAGVAPAVARLRYEGTGACWRWPIVVSGWPTPEPIRPARPGGSTRDRGTAPWNSTSLPPAGPGPGGS